MKSSIALDGDTVVVRNFEDAQDIADGAKLLSEIPQHGADFHHKWSLPTTQVINFYNQYCGDGFASHKPMNAEFWAWVDKKMKDPQYRVFWTYNPSNPYRLAWGDGAR